MIFKVYPQMSVFPLVITMVITNVLSVVGYVEFWMKTELYIIPKIDLDKDVSSIGYEGYSSTDYSSDYKKEDSSGWDANNINLMTGG